jgi:hypothetical protein
VDTGHAYDAFGRTTSLPGGATIAYYANDLVQRQTAGGERKTWQLDAALRLRSWTTEKSTSGTWSTTESKINHYGDDTDKPRWIVENTTSNAVTRNVTALGGELSPESRLL